MARTCTHCGSSLSGQGAWKALLCPECWAGVLVRLERGELQIDLASEYGVAQSAISMKRRLYDKGA